MVPLVDPLVVLVFPKTGRVMDDGAEAVPRVAQMVERLALALVEVEPMFRPADRQDLRELVILLGWWSGRLAASAAALDDAGIGGTVR